MVNPAAKIVSKTADRFRLCPFLLIIGFSIIYLTTADLKKEP
jgi:hypothetical protein